MHICKISENLSVKTGINENAKKKKRRKSTFLKFEYFI